MHSPRAIISAHDLAPCEFSSLDRNMNKNNGQNGSRVTCEKHASQMEIREDHVITPADLDARKSIERSAMTRNCPGQLEKTPFLPETGLDALLSFC